MWKLFIGVLTVCVALSTVLLAFVLLETRSLVRDARGAVVSLGQAASKIAAAAEQARQASAQANLAATEQRAYWQKTSIETYKTTASLRLAIVRTDRSLNDVLVPQIATVLKDADATVLNIGGDVDAAQLELIPALKDLARASAASAAAVSDPHIAEAIANVDETSASAARATEQLAGVAADAKIAADLALQRLRDVLKPVSFARALLERALGLASQAAQIWYAVR